MGIVNVTPDSFSDGGKYFSPDYAIKHALELQEQGADIIDIGAQSTRPGCDIISADEEWQRLKSVLKGLMGKISVPLSVDTFYTDVAEKSIQYGADIINDVSARLTAEKLDLVKRTGCGWVIMHNGSGSAAQVKAFFEDAVNTCVSYGIDRSQLCLDMGLGFGKSYEENMYLVANVSEYKYSSCPLLLGASKKRFIGAGSSQGNVHERIYGNIAADTVAVLGGVDIIRLHDVKNEKQGILMADRLKEYING